MGGHLRAIVTIGVTTCACLAVQAAAIPFTVAADIERPTFVSLDNQDVLDGTEITSMSPDRRLAIFVTQRGSLASGHITQTIWVADIAAITASENQSGHASPRPREVASVAIRRDKSGVANLQWVSPTTLTFTAQGTNDVKQGFLLDLDSGQLVQITHSDTDVESFALQGDDYLYYARAPIPDRQGDYQVVENEDIYDMLLRQPSDDNPIILYRGMRSSHEVTRVAGPIRSVVPLLSISPTGRFALTILPATNAPEGWAEYDVFSPEYRWDVGKRRQDPTSPDLLLRGRYALIDMTANSARPLLDAPNGMLSGNGTPARVFWTRSGNAVVTNTYLPITGVNGSERARRIGGPATIVVDPRTQRFTTLFWEAPVQHVGAASPQIERIVAFDFDRETGRLSVTKRGTGGVVTHQDYQTERGNRDAERRHIESAPQVRFVVRQDLNTPPALYAEGGPCECRQLLLNPWPESAGYDFGRVEMVEWTDQNAIHWRGGLVYPVGYQPGRVYPLVVQTHGFAPSEFLVAGPRGVTTAMAAQPLANAGFFVLQIQDNRLAFTNDEHEASRTAEGYRAGIENLIARGSVDRNRIGIVGFSRTGLATVQLAAQYPELLSAVVLADGAWWSFSSEIYAVNQPSDLVEQARRLTGGDPARVGYGRWFDQNPLYNLASSRAAIRIEADSGPNSLLSSWEHYSILKQSGHAVDYIYFPNGSHIIQKPRERLQSQGGTVDWFRFWLQGYEDPAPEKQGQYSRWRAMRSSRESLR